MIFISRIALTERDKTEKTNAKRRQRRGQREDKCKSKREDKSKNTIAKRGQIKKYNRKNIKNIRDQQQHKQN